MRVYVRIFISKAWGADDLLLIVAIVGSHVYYSLLCDPFYLT